MPNLRDCWLHRHARRCMCAESLSSLKYATPILLRHSPTCKRADVHIWAVAAGAIGRDCRLRTIPNSAGGPAGSVVERENGTLDRKVQRQERQPGERNGI